MNLYLIEQDGLTDDGKRMLANHNCYVLADDELKALEVWRDRIKSFQNKIAFISIRLAEQDTLIQK